MCLKLQNADWVSSGGGIRDLLLDRDMIYSDVVKIIKEEYEIGDDNVKKYHLINNNNRKVEVDGISIEKYVDSFPYVGKMRLYLAEECQ